MEPFKKNERTLYTKGIETAFIPSKATKQHPKIIAFVTKHYVKMDNTVSEHPFSVQIRGITRTSAHSYLDSLLISSCPC